MPSPFLLLPETVWVAANELAFAVRDRYPVSPGHTLVIPRREVPTWFEATREEQLALLALVDEVKRQLDEELRPDGYNLGINAGEAAGQTVMHLHVHVIPRFRGDVDDPRGGVRHVIPGRGNYLAGRAALPDCPDGAACLRAAAKTLSPALPRSSSGATVGACQLPRRLPCRHTASLTSGRGRPPHGSIVPRRALAQCPPYHVPTHLECAKTSRLGNLRQYTRSQ